jgi:hypothetical protein
MISSVGQGFKLFSSTKYFVCLTFDVSSCCGPLSQLVYPPACPNKATNRRHLIVLYSGVGCKRSLVLERKDRLLSLHHPSIHSNN